MGRIQLRFFLMFTGQLWAAAWCHANPVHELERLPVPGGHLYIEWKSDFDPSEQEKLRAWLNSASETVSQLNGNFPRQETHITLNRHNRGQQAIPWAHTVRHTNPEGVEFHVNPNMDLQDFVDDWTAPHEFSHLFIPYPGRRDIWISEGFASYYQNILMARSGVLSDQKAWQKLADGFKRASQDQNRELSLGELSPKMRESGAFMRVYWSGALYFLEADIALRRDGQSLDAVITEFTRCCRHQQRYWNGAKLVNTFDQISQSNLFSHLFKSYEEEHFIRDYRQILNQLGIQLVEDRVRFYDSKEGESLRLQITAPIY